MRTASVCCCCEKFTRMHFNVNATYSAAASELRTRENGQPSQNNNSRYTKKRKISIYSPQWIKCGAKTKLNSAAIAAAVVVVWLSMWWLGVPNNSLTRARVLVVCVCVSVCWKLRARSLHLRIRITSAHTRHPKTTLKLIKISMAFSVPCTRVTY